MTDMTALNKRSQEVRGARAALRDELRSGLLTFEDALYDLRAARIPLYRLVGWMPAWGPTKVERLFRAVLMSPDRRVGTLTDRERDALLIAHRLMNVRSRKGATA